jgi:L-iditol 2-dehydrogenase
MKAVVLTGIRKMEQCDIPCPRITTDMDVLLKVGSIGICGSDVHYYTAGRIGSQVVQYPFRVGHEFAATVIETGKAVKGLKPGDGVAVEPAMSCGMCDQCKANRRHTCRKLRFLGCPGQAEGCLSEYIVMPAECCYPVKSGTTLEQAAIVEPLSIGLYAVESSAQMKGARIAILGAGPIGLSVLLCARVGGAECIYVTDKIDARLEAARRAGAGWTGNPDRQDIVADIVGLEPFLLDVVFECCGQQEALDQAVSLLKPGGKLMAVGIPEVDRVSFAIDTMRRRELCIQNVRRQNECVRPALDLIENGKVDVDFMITHRFPLDETKTAFDLVADYRDGVVKAMVNLD